jgi:hypothetical protein
MMDAVDASAGPRKKHRHDLGHEDHGPVYAAGTTRGIQALLGLWIALTVVLVVYTLIQVSRPGPSPAPATPTIPTTGQ